MGPYRKFQTSCPFPHRVIGALSALVIVVAPAQALAQGGTWSIKAPMPTARWGAASAILDGKVYVVGGQSATQPEVSVLEVYNPVRNSWATRAPMPTARFAPVAEVVGGKLYVIGGYLPDLGCCGVATAVVEVYNPVTDSWSTGTPMPTARQRAAGTAISGKIYIVGGNIPGLFPALSTLEVYDPATDTWDTSRAPMPTARFAAGAAALDGLLYVVGGELCGGCAVTGTLEVYDPLTDEWSSAASMPTPRDELTNAVVTLNGQVYVVGGRLTPSGGATNAVERYDPVVDMWTAATSMPTAREQAAASGIGNRLYVAGGRLGDGNVTSVLEMFFRTSAGP